MAKKFTTQRSTYVDPADGIEKRVPKITGRLITLNKDNPEALYNLGTFCLQDNRYELGIELLQKSLKLRDNKEARLNLATCYKFAGNWPKSREILKKIIEDFPLFPLAHNNLGLMDYDVREIPLSISRYHRALELKPNYADAKWNLSLALNLQYFTDLELGKTPDISVFHQAMELFEARFEKSNPVVIATHDTAKRWNGEELKEGESLIILCEQGIGDMVQFMRYAYNFKPEQVKLHLPDGLHFMVKKPYTAVNTTLGDRSTYWAPLMSVSKYFPITGAPYISVPQAGIHKEIQEAKNLKIGFVWKGNPDHANDRNRSRAMNDFKWLADYGSVFSLQKDSKARTNWFKQLGLSHWAYTVGALNGLDIVVTVDTSIAHVCGAMGKPCIILIPQIGIDWRWGEIGENCIWYDSVRFARMQSMDKARELLERFIAGNWDKRIYALDKTDFTAEELQKLWTPVFSGIVS